MTNEPFADLPILMTEVYGETLIVKWLYAYNSEKAYISIRIRDNYLNLDVDYFLSTLI
jgi:hypothetical protein